jgi:hypothetical protein
VFLGAANEIVKCHKLAHFSIIKRAGALAASRRPPMKNNNISLLSKNGLHLAAGGDNGPLDGLLPLSTFMQR